MMKKTHAKAKTNREAGSAIIPILIVSLAILAICTAVYGLLLQRSHTNKIMQTYGARDAFAAQLDFAIRDPASLSISLYDQTCVQAALTAENTYHNGLTLPNLYITGSVPSCMVNITNDYTDPVDGTVYSSFILNSATDALGNTKKVAGTLTSPQYYDQFGAICDPIVSTTCQYQVVALFALNTGPIFDPSFPYGPSVKTKYIVSNYTNSISGSRTFQGDAMRSLASVSRVGDTGYLMCYQSDGQDHTGQISYDISFNGSAPVNPSTGNPYDVMACTSGTGVQLCPANTFQTGTQMDGTPLCGSISNSKACPAGQVATAVTADPFGGITMACMPASCERLTNYGGLTDGLSRIGFVAITNTDGLGLTAQVNCTMLAPDTGCLAQPKTGIYPLTSGPQIAGRMPCLAPQVLPNATPPPPTAVTPYTPPPTAPDLYVWEYGPLSTCNNTCGSQGTATQSATCVDVVTNLPAPGMCSPSPAPDTTLSCEDDSKIGTCPAPTSACGGTFVEPHGSTYNGPPVTLTCAANQYISCSPSTPSVVGGADGDQDIWAPGQCTIVSNGPCTASLVYSGWGACSATCGTGGTQSRTVTDCQIAGSSVSSSYCSAITPILTQPCSPTPLACIPAQCGGANNNSYLTATDVNTAGLCVAGNTSIPAPVTGAGPTWNWTCYGNDGSNQTCQTLATSCPAVSSLSWGSGCTGSLPVTPANTSSVSVTNTAGGYTGSETWSCSSAGAWTGPTAQTCTVTAPIGPYCYAGGDTNLAGSLVIAICEHGQRADGSGGTFSSFITTAPCCSIRNISAENSGAGSDNGCQCNSLTTGNMPACGAADLNTYSNITTLTAAGLCTAGGPLTGPVQSGGTWIWQCPGAPSLGNSCMAYLPAACQAQTATWSSGIYTCATELPSTANGSSASVGSSNSNSGAATFQCVSGTWQPPTGTSCEAACASTPVTWSGSASNCNYTLPQSPDGLSVTVNSNDYSDGFGWEGRLGSATYQCVGGVWQPPTGTSCTVACGSDYLGWTVGVNNCGGISTQGVYGSTQVIMDDSGDGSASFKCVAGTWTQLMSPAPVCTP